MCPNIARSLTCAPVVGHGPKRNTHRVQRTHSTFGRPTRLLRGAPYLRDTCMHLLNLLNGRPHLGLEDIESVALMDRYDSKFLVPEHWLSHTLTQLKDHAVLAIADTVSTTYRNLYFDSPDNVCVAAARPRQDFPVQGAHPALRQHRGHLPRSQNARRLRQNREAPCRARRLHVGRPVERRRAAVSPAPPRGHRVHARARAGKPV